MKKIMFILILISSLWSEEIKIDDVYEVYISKTKNIDLVGASKQEVYFGEYSKYMENNSEELKAIAKGAGNGLASGAGTTANAVGNSVGNATGKAVGQGLGMGLGIGLVMGIGAVVYDKATENEVFILVNDYTNQKGEKTRVSALIYFKSFKDTVVIKDFLEQEINKKYRN